MFMPYTWKMIKFKTGRHWVMSVILEIMKTGVKITFEICSFLTTNYLSLLKSTVTLLESFVLLALSFLEPALCSVFQGTSAAIVSLDFLALVGFCSGQKHTAEILLKLTNSNFTFILCLCFPNHRFMTLHDPFPAHEVCCFFSPSLFHYVPPSWVIEQEYYFLVNLNF